MKNMSPERVRKVNVQRLFGAALVIKIVSSVASVLLGSPWILGLAVPVMVMIAYMVIGHYCREDDVSLERFADSCYYIGFIFTITSIIVSLFDLPSLSASEGMRNIALRFGAAMVSTVLGMGVRVYLVSFRKDADDAVRDAEEAVLDATRMFVSQLNSVMDNLKQFEHQVIDAAKHTVENVNRQVEALGTQYAQSLNGFYVKVTEENKAAFSVLIDEVKGATTRLADSVDAYSSGIKGNLEAIESKVTEFAEAVTKRLESTTFPDDYFARELKAPLELLKGEATILGQSVRAVSSEVDQSSGAIVETLKRITTKTKKTEAAMDAMTALSEQHRVILSNSELQLNSLINLAARLEQIDNSLNGTAQAVGSNSSASAELLEKVGALTSGSAALQLAIKDAMLSVASQLDANATLSASAIQRFERQATDLHLGTTNMIAKLQAHTDCTGLVAQRLDEVSAITQNVAGQLQDISATKSSMIADAREAVNAITLAVQLSNQAAETVVGAAESVSKTMTQVAEAAGKLRQSQDAQSPAFVTTVSDAITARPDLPIVAPVLNDVHSPAAASASVAASAGSVVLSAGPTRLESIADPVAK